MRNDQIDFIANCFYLYDRKGEILMANASTSGLWHIGDDGQPHQCHAKNGRCPYGSTGHYETVQEAFNMAEILSESKIPGLMSMKKTASNENIDPAQTLPPTIDSDVYDPKSNGMSWEDIGRVEKTLGESQEAYDDAQARLEDERLIHMKALDAYYDATVDSTAENCVKNSMMLDDMADRCETLEEPLEEKVVKAQGTRVTPSGLLADDYTTSNSKLNERLGSPAILKKAQMSEDGNKIIMVFQSEDSDRTWRKTFDSRVVTMKAACEERSKKLRKAADTISSIRSALRTADPVEYASKLRDLYEYERSHGLSTAGLPKESTIKSEADRSDGIHEINAAVELNHRRMHSIPALKKVIRAEREFQKALDGMKQHSSLELQQQSDPEVSIEHIRERPGHGSYSIIGASDDGRRFAVKRRLYDSNDEYFTEQTFVLDENGEPLKNSDGKYIVGNKSRGKSYRSGAMIGVVWNRQYTPGELAAMDMPGFSGKLKPDNDLSTEDKVLADAASGVFDNGRNGKTGFGPKPRFHGWHQLQ